MALPQVSAPEPPTPVPAPAPREALPDALSDPRVSAVLAVLRGGSLDAIAAQSSVEPVLLQRWVGAFVAAGISSVVNRADPLVALQRQRLLSAVSSEINAPLATARESVRRLSGRTDEPHTMVAQVGLLATALDQLGERVSDAELLIASTLGSIAVAPAPVTVGALCSRLEGLGPVRGKGLDYELDVDPDLFGRVLRDVWAAAARPPRPRYRQMYVRVVGTWVEFRVLRQGDPIDTELLHALFEPFDYDRADSGVTIGLYLARALTVAHGGTLGVDQDDHGAAFWVRVPARAADVLPGPRRRRIAMSTFKLACGDVMPGCSARFSDSSRDGLLGQVAAHAAADHGISVITPEILAAVEAKISVA